MVGIYWKLKVIVNSFFKRTGFDVFSFQQGQHLDRACQESDVVVKIGSSACNVTSLSRQQLTCRPPLSQPPGIDAEQGQPNAQELPEVVVSTQSFNSARVSQVNYF